MRAALVMNELTRQQNISMTMWRMGVGKVGVGKAPPSPLPDAIVSYSVIVIMAMMLVIMVKCDGINYGFDEEIDWGYCSAERRAKGYGGGGVPKINADWMTFANGF
jgi:hypothetical protein